MSRPDDPEDARGFLSGWSRRKLAARQKTSTEGDTDAPPEIDAEPDAATAKVAQDATEEVDDEVVAALPPLDEIMDGSDIKPFLAKGVPANLRNAAMRRLWLASPGVRDYSDPAVDYAWDWNAPGGVPGGGGVLSEEGVAKMLKGLIGGKSDVPPEDSGEAALAEAGDADLPASDTKRGAPPQGAAAPEEDLPPSPVRRSDASSTQAAGAAPDAERKEALREGEASTSPLPPARRHGGAVPG